jgi:uncharacterized protein (TIGR02466 family)
MLITFPTVIYKANLIFDEQDKDTIDLELSALEQKINYGSNPWISTTKNSMGLLEPHKDIKFSSINAAVEKHLSRFCHELRVRDHIKFSAKQSWVNFYSKNDYQESHYHPNFTFSAVVYYKTTANTKIVFENTVTDMLPLEVDCQTDLNRQYITVHPRDGDLLIFRSYLRHYVPRHIDEETKISIAYNFKAED